MKKLLAACILIFVAFYQLSGQTVEKITSFEFTKQTRGMLDQVVITKDSVHGVIENHKETQKSRHYAADISEDQWAGLVLSLKSVSLSAVDGLQSPTMNRAHDGAIHSTIVITFGDGKSISHGFDNENPHPDLKPLLDAMLGFKAVSSK